MRKKICTVEEESQQWEKLLGEHEIQRYWALEAGLWLTAGEIREQTPSKIQRVWPVGWRMARSRHEEHCTEERHLRMAGLAVSEHRVIL